MPGMGRVVSGLGESRYRSWNQLVFTKIERLKGWGWVNKMSMMMSMSSMSMSMSMMI